LAVATATGQFKGEGWRLRHGGSPFWANVVITALRDTEGELIGFAKVTRDMSDRRDAEQKVAEAYRAEAAALHQADLAKNQFLSRVSHELRTPLNAILGFGQLLQLEGPGAEQVESIDEIMNAGRHLLELINDVLDITQVESGDLDLTLEPIDIAAAVHDVVQLLTPFAAARGIVVTAPSPHHDGIDVLADRRRLKQVLMNLLFNAIKYNDEGGTVRITFETRPTGQVVLSITDSGPGIDEDKLTLIFAPFERLDAARSNIEGTGLGLALSRRLVEAMGGVIGVESIRDEGSTFWVELPSVTTPVS
jgi:signal transduction histidine kinase